jgi:poly(3-hydroxybutyrate) depolymerase
MLYHAYEMTHAAFSPMRAAARVGQQVMRNPLNPMAATYGSRAMSAALEMFINATRRYGKPAFGISEVEVDGAPTPVVEEVVWSAPFGNLLHFRRESAAAVRRNDPKVLMVAPMSGHYATLLRGTVRDMLPNHEVYITDWTDARDVPLAFGEFDLDDYTDYLVAMIEHLSRDG